jgi:protein TonB
VTALMLMPGGRIEPVLDLPPEPELAIRVTRPAVSKARDGQPLARLSLVASLILHGLLAAALLGAAPVPKEAAGEAAVEVTLVAPDAVMGDAEADALAGGMAEVPQPEPEEATPEMQPTPTPEPVSEPALDLPEPSLALPDAPPEVLPLPSIRVPETPLAPPELASAPTIEPPALNPTIAMPEAPPASSELERPDPVVEAALPPLPASPIALPQRPVSRPPAQPVRMPEPTRPAKPVAAPKPLPVAKGGAPDTGRNARTQVAGNAATGGGGGTAASAFSSWSSQVRAAIQNARVATPELDDERPRPVRVSFSVGRSGQLLSVSLQASSGHGGLDAAALAKVRRAAPFAPVPEGTPAPITLSLPVVIRLD